MARRGPIICPSDKSATKSRVLERASRRRSANSDAENVSPTLESDWRSCTVLFTVKLFFTLLGDWYQEGEKNLRRQKSSAEGLELGGGVPLDEVFAAVNHVQVETGIAVLEQGSPFRG